MLDEPAANGVDAMPSRILSAMEMVEAVPNERVV